MPCVEPLNFFGICGAFSVLECAVAGVVDLVLVLFALIVLLVMNPISVTVWLVSLEQLATAL